MLKKTNSILFDQYVWYNVTNVFYGENNVQVEMIAAINEVSRKTIERYIASIKRKLDCFTLFQMGEKTASNGISDFLRHIRCN